MRLETYKNEIHLSEVYNPIVINSEESKFSICQRDNGFEFTYDGERYEAKNGNVYKVGNESRDVTAEILSIRTLNDKIVCYSNIPKDMYDEFTRLSNMMEKCKESLKIVYVEENRQRLIDLYNKNFKKLKILFGNFEI